MVIVFLILCFVAQLMLEKDHITEIPQSQKMERQETIAREHNEEHRSALQRAVALSVPHAFIPSQYGTFEEPEESEQSDQSSSSKSSKRSSKRETWDQLIEHLFEKDESGHMVLKKSPSTD